VKFPLAWLVFLKRPADVLPECSRFPEVASAGNPAALIKARAFVPDQTGSKICIVLTPHLP
jgi:hypothetical protein